MRANRSGEGELFISLRGTQLEPYSNEADLPVYYREAAYLRLNLNRNRAGKKGTIPLESIPRWQSPGGSRL